MASLRTSFSLYLLLLVVWFSHVGWAPPEQLGVRQVLRRWTITACTHAPFIPRWFWSRRRTHGIGFGCFRGLLTTLYDLCMCVLERIESLFDFPNKIHQFFLIFEGFGQLIILCWSLHSLNTLYLALWSSQSIDLCFFTVGQLDIDLEQLYLLFAGISTALLTLGSCSWDIPLVLHTLFIILVNGLLKFLKLGFCVHLNLTLWDTVAALA